MYASHFNWLQVSFRRTSLSSTGFESRKGERFPRAQGRRYLPVSASILLYFESLILNPTLRAEAGMEPKHKHHDNDRRKAIPGDRVLQMLVAQRRLERAY